MTPQQRYLYLRKFFSKEFLDSHKYTLERNEPLPHEGRPTKACSRCEIKQPNNFEFFGRVPFGPLKLNRWTTGPTCLGCAGRAVSRAAADRRERGARADELMAKDAVQGAYLKGPDKID